MMSCALAACCGYGATDFLGGLTARKQSVAAALLVSQPLAFLVIGIAALLTPGHPTGADMVLGLIAGTVGGAGIPLLYQSLARETMGSASSLSGLMYAVVPVVAGLLCGTRLTPPQIIGLVLAVLAIYALTRSHTAAQGPQAPTRLLIPILAGCAFGAYHVLISRTTSASGLWPLVAARSALLVGVMAYVLVRPPERLTRWWVHVSALAALMGVGATILAFMAVRSDQLTIAGVLIALSPAVTTALARVLLHERLERDRIVGLMMALMAIIFMVA